MGYRGRDQCVWKECTNGHCPDMLLNIQIKFHFVKDRRRQSYLDRVGTERVGAVNQIIVNVILSLDRRSLVLTCLISWDAWYNTS